MDETKKLLLGTVVLAIIGGNSGSVLNSISPSVRALPFTLNDGNALRAECLSQHEGTRRELEAIRTRLTIIEQRLLRSVLLIPPKQEKTLLPMTTAL